MVSPYAVRLKLEQVGNAGKVAGRLSAISTIGALDGTFSASLLLIPLIGTQRSFLLYALILALVVMPTLGRRWLVPAVVAVAIAGC